MTLFINFFISYFFFKAISWMPDRRTNGLEKKDNRFDSKTHHYNNIMIWIKNKNSQSK